MSVIQNNLLMTPEGYQISRSVRLRSSASGYFSRTPSSTTSRTIWTWSAWVKRGSLPSSRQGLFIAQTSGSVYWGLEFDANNCLNVYDSNAAGALTTSSVYRDPSSWYHIVVALDTTQATAANRTKLYVNGSQVTTFGTTNYPTQNSTSQVNTASVLHSIGNWNPSVSNLPFDGYLTEVNFIDGQALTPSSFGENDAVTGVWKPKKYAGTYGTNGFYLNFSDNSAATAAAIGKDSSGNGNNWTPNNISVTAGVTYDSMIDVPTMYADGGNGRGNYCTWNPACGTGSSAYSNGNLAVSRSSAGTDTILSTMAMPSGSKHYFEMSPASVSGAYPTIGFENINIRVNINSNPAVRYQPNGVISVNGVDTSGFATYIAGDIVGIAVEPSSGKYWFSKNGTWQNGDPVAGTITTATVSTTIEWCPAVGAYNGVGAITLNCGQRPFAYTPPTGFKALNTQNLPDATIKKGNQFFDATTYSGTGSTQTIVNAAGFKPDLVWAKRRSTLASHAIYDSTRGALKLLMSDTTGAEYTDAAGSGLTAFASNGFTVGTDTASAASINSSGGSFVGWQWKESVTAGFDIVTFANSGGGTFNHSLGVKPSMMIVKNRTGTADSWLVYHSIQGATKYLRLESTNAVATSSAVWSNTEPTSTQFTVGSGLVTGNFVAYLFAEVAGFSKFGSYTGNGSADGPFVFCGFKPRFILVKSSTSAQDWKMIDTARNSYNSSNSLLGANISGAEDTNAAYDFDILSNGFKPRNTFGYSNTSGATYIYAAFAENPFKNSLAR